MSFTVAYNIKAIDQFTSVAKAVKDSFLKMERAAAAVNRTQSKASEISKVRAQEQARHIAAMNAEREASARIITSQKENNAANSEARRKMSELRLETMRTKTATSAATKKQKEATRALREQHAAMKKSISLMRDMGSKANQFGNWMLTRVAAPLVGVGVLFKNSADQFNKDMADVGTLIPGQTEKLKKYKEEVLGMAVAYGKSDLGAVAKGLYQDISNLGDSEETVKKLDIAMRSSVAGRAMEADAMNLLSGVSADYGDTSAAMMQRVSDLAFKTVELGSTTFPELAQQMGRTTTQAKMMGVSVEELFGQYAGLTSGTVRTDMVSTRLAGVFAALGRRTGPIVDVMKKMGVASGKELVARFGGLQGALLALRREVGDDEIAFSKLFEDQEGRLGALAMTGAKAKEVAREVALMGKAAGATETAFYEQTQGIGASAFKADQARAKFARLRVEWGDKLAPLADKLMDRFDGLVNWLSSLDDETVQAAISFGVWAIKIGVAAKVIGGLMSFTGGMANMFFTYTKGASASALAAGKMSAATSVTGKAIMGLNSAIPVLAALLAMYESLNFAAEQFESWHEKQLERKRQEASTNYDFKKADVSSWSMKSLEQFKKNDQAAIESTKGIFGWVSSEDEKQNKIRMARIAKIEEEMKSRQGNDKKKIDASDISRKDVLEIKLSADSGTKVEEVNHKKKSGYANVDVGSNYK